MVDEITPTYYAPGDQPAFILTGRGFHQIPDDAVGIRSIDNANPLGYINASAPMYLYDIIERGDTRLVLSHRSSDTALSDAYLGGLVSQDREIVFWTNETQPLPTNRGSIVDTEIIEKR